MSPTTHQPRASARGSGSFRRWERSLARALRPLRLRSLRSRIVAFTLAATLIPTLTTAWISYAHSRDSLSAGIAAELRAASVQAAWELDALLGEGSGSRAGAESSASLDARTRSELRATLASLAQRMGLRGELVVLGPAGEVIATSRSPATSTDTRWAAGPAPGTPAEYRGSGGVRVLGVHTRLPRIGWTVAAEIPRATAYAAIGRLWTTTAVLGLALLLVVGFLASTFGILIVGPLNRLRDAATRVASGDLDVWVPVSVNGEIGYLTEVFNLMVERLRDHRRELERLSETDALTGLHNRHRLMDVLHQEARRSTRHGRPFSVLMIDVDHFKLYNDTYGHVDGDELLRRVAGVLRVTMRTVDYNARYGGDEFLVLMPETDLREAVAAAERLRTRLAEEHHGRGRAGITLSIGAAEHSPVLRRADEVVAAADRALYRAKECGRNRTVAADRPAEDPERRERHERLRDAPAPPRFALNRAEVM